MKLVMTLLIRDEVDIVRSNIEYHLNAGVDYFIATDNLSQDGTTEILRDYEAKGVLRYIFQSEDDYSQHRWVTTMARLAAIEHGADWVINNDADEFWLAPGNDLKAALSSVPHEVIALHSERHNFLPPRHDDDRAFHESMIVRHAVSFNALGQPLPGKVCHRALPDISVSQGNHSVAHNGKTVATEPFDGEILHFPLRSYAQFANKIAKGGAAYARNRQLSPDIGGTWRKLHQQSDAELEQHFVRERRSTPEIEHGLASGALITDVRLRDILASLPSRV